jgi:hypothetical protein
MPGFPARNVLKSAQNRLFPALLVKTAREYINTSIFEDFLPARQNFANYIAELSKILAPFLRSEMRSWFLLIKISIVKLIIP